MSETKSIESETPAAVAGAARGSASFVVSEKAIEEVRAVHEARREEQIYGPRYHAKCPDCGATVDVQTLENGRHELKFVKHAT